MDFLIPLVAIAGVLGLALLLYLFSRSSRQTFNCPKCGERITTDYLNARRCGMCGAELEKEGYR